MAGVGELAAGVGGLAGAGGLAGGGDVGLEALGRTGPSSVGSSSALEGFPGTSGSRGLPGLAIITSKKPSSAEVESLPFRNQPVSTTLSSRVTDPASTPPPCVVSETAHCFELRPKGALPPVHVSNRYRSDASASKNSFWLSTSGLRALRFGEDAGSPQAVSASCLSKSLRADQDHSGTGMNCF